MGTLLRRIWHLANRRRYERELVQEMREHRDAKVVDSYAETVRMLAEAGYRVHEIPLERRTPGREQALVGRMAGTDVERTCVVLGRMGG